MARDMTPDEVETGLNAVVETVLESVSLALPNFPGTAELRADILQTVRDACANHWDEILAIFYGES